MANIKKTLESGAELEVQVASFEKSHKLLQAIKASMIPMENIIDVIVSPTVQPALWDCMGTVLYDGKKIGRDTFESEQAREDYLPVAMEVLAANLRPFFKSLASSLSGGPVTPTSADQK